MPEIVLETWIHAPIERVFDLCLSVDMHVASAKQSGEVAVGGVTSGLLTLGDEVTLEGRHFGVRQRLTSRITELERPTHFRDSMVRGAFRRIDHDHYFEAHGDRVLMRDRFDFDAPLWVLGYLANALFLTRYMRRFLIQRNETIKVVAESDAWQQILPPGDSSL